MIIYTTETGSIYEVDTDTSRVRQLKRSAVCKSGRVAGEWRTYKTITGTVGTALTIYWGDGPDEHSANAVLVGNASDFRLRLTVTSRIVAISDGNYVS